MPKLKEPPEKARITSFKAAVAKYMTIKNITKDTLATSLLMSRSTFWHKMNHPDTFRLGELRQLYALLDFELEDKQILL